MPVMKEAVTPTSVLIEMDQITAGTEGRESSFCFVSEAHQQLHFSKLLGLVGKQGTGRPHLHHKSGEICMGPFHW